MSKKKCCHMEYWIKPAYDLGEACPTYRKMFSLKKELLKEAKMEITALGVYQIRLNGKKITNAVLMPGWTSYENRLQVQTYDITEQLRDENCLEITVGKGWYRSPVPGWLSEEDKIRRRELPPALFCRLSLLEERNQLREIRADLTWEVRKSPVRFSEIYDGETYDAREENDEENGPVALYDYRGGKLIPQQGEWICEQERIAAARVFTDAQGATIVDFGQEITGYAEFVVNAEAGDIIEISHGEVLDKEGNFYNDNYRSAKSRIRYICREGCQVWHPQMTFFGFRYLRLDRFPGEVKAEQFTAIAVYSDMKRTGFIESGHPLLNRLISNVFWGQRGNFLDVPTDCPQRDERMGWTGDAQVFIRTAAYNYDVERFFTKWLTDLSLEQREDGSIPYVIPANAINSGSAAWDDAAVICPWQLYLTYGNADILRRQFHTMTRYIDYITNTTTTQYLWTGGTHFGDWLGLDAEEGSYEGASRKDLIASAFYAHSTELVVKAGEVLGEEVSQYKELLEHIRQRFRETYQTYLTQTEYVLSIHFGLTENPVKAAEELAAMIHRDGDKLQTGFVGTPYLLHVLSRFGYHKLAYKLLLREEYPSWLYPVTRGATTIWEHWDGMKGDGSFWSADMNSFNHYAYGAVLDWVYEVAAGIQPVEEAPGFKKLRLEPHPTRELGWLSVRFESRCGTVCSSWRFEGDQIRYEITTPGETQLVINGKERQLKAGKYVFYAKSDDRITVV